MLPTRWRPNQRPPEVCSSGSQMPTVSVQYCFNINAVWVTCVRGLFVGFLRRLRNTSLLMSHVCLGSYLSKVFYGSFFNKVNLNSMWESKSVREIETDWWLCSELCTSKQRYKAQAWVVQMCTRSENEESRKSRRLFLFPCSVRFSSEINFRMKKIVAVACSFAAILIGCIKQLLHFCNGTRTR